MGGEEETWEMAESDFAPNAVLCFHFVFRYTESDLANRRVAMRTFIVFSVTRKEG